MRKYVLLIVVFLFLSTILFSQKSSCFGEKRELKLGKTTPYTKVAIDKTEGYFLVDFGTTGSTIDPSNFINGQPKLVSNSENKFDNFIFYGSWGTVNLNIQDHSTVTGLINFKQAGIIGTDFLSLNIFTIDYENELLYRANRDDFCSNNELEKLGFIAVSAIGYYSNNPEELNNNCTSNVPTIPIKIGKIAAIAQIDTGFDDALHNNSLNINEAFFNSMVDAGINLVENPTANLNLSTCVKDISEQVKSYKLPKGISFSITSIDGTPIMLKEDINIFLKQTPPEAKKCGGIGTWKIPAGQIGASFLLDSKKVIFDPFQSKVWFYTK